MLQRYEVKGRVRLDYQSFYSVYAESPEEACDLCKRGIICPVISIPHEDLPTPEFLQIISCTKVDDYSKLTNDSTPKSDVSPSETT